MNCFHLPIEVTASMSRNQSSLHHLSNESGTVPVGSLIRDCLSKISPDNPEKGIAAAKVMQVALREVVNQERVKSSLAEYYGVNYLLTSLNQAIHVYENEGRVDELMFVTMRIGRELTTYQGSNVVQRTDAKLI